MPGVPVGVIRKGLAAACKEGRIIQWCTSHGQMPPPMHAGLGKDFPLRLNGNLPLGVDARAIYSHGAIR